MPAGRRARRGREFRCLGDPAFLAETRLSLGIKNDEIVTVGKDGVTLTDSEGNVQEREPEEVTWDEDAAEKGGYATFMLKEIHEQPDAVAETITDRLPSLEGVDLSDVELDEDFLRDVERIVIVACGTSYHAGLVGRYDRAVGPGPGRDGHHRSTATGTPSTGRTISSSA